MNVGVTPLSPFTNWYWPMKPAKWLVPEMTVTRPNDRPTPPRIVVLAIEAVGAAQPRRNRAVVAGNQAARAFAALTLTGEDQRAGISVDAGFGLLGSNSEY